MPQLPGIPSQILTEGDLTYFTIYTIRVFPQIYTRQAYLAYKVVGFSFLLEAMNIVAMSIRTGM